MLSPSIKSGAAKLASQYPILIGETGEQKHLSQLRVVLFQKSQ